VPKRPRLTSCSYLVYTARGQIAVEFCGRNPGAAGVILSHWPGVPTWHESASLLASRSLAIRAEGSHAPDTQLVAAGNFLEVDGHRGARSWIPRGEPPVEFRQHVQDRVESSP